MVDLIGVKSPLNVTSTLSLPFVSAQQLCQHLKTAQITLGLQDPQDRKMNTSLIWTWIEIPWCHIMWPTFADQNPHLAIIGRAVSSCQIFTLPCVSANLTTRSWSQSTSQYSFIETLHGEEWNWTGAKLETALLLLLSRSALLSSRSSLFIIIKMRSLTRVAWTRQGSRSVPDISFFSSPTAAHRNVKMSTQAGIYPILSNFPFSKHKYMSKVFVFKLKWSFMCYLCMSSVRSQPRITKYEPSTLKQRDWVLFYKRLRNFICFL